MRRNGPAALRELHDWLSPRMAEAEAILPELLDLPLPALHLRLSVRPELRTVGIMQSLLDLAEKTLGRFRHHAYQLTSIAVEIVEEIVLPPEEQDIARRLRGQAWKTYARALRGIGRLEAAQEAVSTARAAFEGGHDNEWYLATVDVVEARILHELGHPREALPLARCAQSVLLRHDDDEGYLKACLAEALILRKLEGWEAMTAFWLSVSEVQHEQERHRVVARLDYHAGLFELRHGSPRQAWHALTEACNAFRRLGMTAEAIAAHRAMAEAAIHLRWPSRAVSERYMAYRALLEIGSLDEAAAVAAQTLEVLLPVGRSHEAVSFATSLPAVFEDAGLRASALQAFRWLRGRADSGELAVDDAVAVRCYFEDLFLRPNAPFEAPDRTRRVWEIRRSDDYESALATLGGAANLYLHMIERRIAAAPDRNPVLRGNQRLFRARAYARYPALRVFYTYDDTAVYLLYVDLDDELAE